MAKFFVEQLAATVSLPELIDDLVRVRETSRRMTAAGRPVRWLHTTFVPAREACLSVVDAVDERSIVAALADAGIHAAAVLPAVALPPAQHGSKPSQPPGCDQ